MAKGATLEINNLPNLFFKVKYVPMYLLCLWKTYQSTCTWYWYYYYYIFIIDIITIILIDIITIIFIIGIIIIYMIYIARTV